LIAQTTCSSIKRTPPPEFILPGREVFPTSVQLPPMSLPPPLCPSLTLFFHYDVSFSTGPKYRKSDVAPRTGRPCAPEKPKGHGLVSPSLYLYVVFLFSFISGLLPYIPPDRYLAALPFPADYSFRPNETAESSFFPYGCTPSMALLLKVCFFFGRLRIREGRDAPHTLSVLLNVFFFHRYVEEPQAADPESSRAILIQSFFLSSGFLPPCDVLHF